MDPNLPTTVIVDNTTNDLFYGPEAFTVKCNVIIKSISVLRLSIICTEVGTLDVSHCSNLSMLLCPNNKLTKIILTKNIHTLNVAYNNLTKIKLPENLRKLDCSQNKISKIKLTKNLMLLRCNDNIIAKLNISLHEKLKILYCSGNKLKKLKASPNLVNMTCDNNLLNKIILNEPLYSLKCSDNELTELNINPCLQELYCENNNITTLKLNSFLKFRKTMNLVDQDTILVPYKMPQFHQHSNSYGDKCAICSKPNNLILTDCKHPFHSMCIIRIPNNLCPCCKTIVSQIDKM